MHDLLVCAHVLIIYYFYYFLIAYFPQFVSLVQEVVLKDTPNEAKDPDGGCAC